MRVRFANCHLDTDARQLVRDGREIHLSPKAFKVLKHLLEARPRALSKSELLDRVWTGVFVTEGSLARVINEIRTAIGDAARDGHIVRTVHGYGYAFAAEIRSERTRSTAGTGHPVCWVFHGSRETALPDGEHVLGREPEAAVWLDSPNVSRHHARIVITGAEATIEDLGSKNGSFVGGARISAPTQLRSGDKIRIGPFTLVFKITSQLGTTETGAVRSSDDG